MTIHNIVFVALNLSPLLLGHVASQVRSSLFDIVVFSQWWYCWYLRRRRSDPAAFGDGILFFIFLILHFRDALWRSLGQVDRVWLATAVGFVIVVSITAVFRTIIPSHAGTSNSNRQKRERECRHRFKEPLIYRSRTTHSRIFPRQHSFSYSYLLVAIPVGYRGCCGGLLSVDTDVPRSLFHVQGSDYLIRDDGAGDLETKLTSYLQSQGVDRMQWSYAYLVTAPRFLGYSFNPASFWYLYDDDHRLIKMVIEVNNTFDERRMYLLDAQDSSNDEDVAANGFAKGEGKATFKDAWQKDFHVSPFNSRKGSYALSADDPFGGDRPEPGPVNTTIVLKSSKSHGKLVARLFSQGDALSPSQLSAFDALRLIAGWWWVGFMTFPRILKEAFRLFFTKKLKVWFRPEVLSSSIGRTSTAHERLLEMYFTRYLMYAVLEHGNGVSVMCRTSDGFERLIGTKGEGGARRIEFKILTPAFFARFVHYRNTSEALDRECFFADDKEATAWTSEPELLGRIFAAADREVMQTPLRAMSAVDAVRWAVHERLRSRPAKQAYSGPEADGARPNTSVVDLREGTLSPLDAFVVKECSAEEARMYRRKCAMLFLATTFAFDIPPVIQLLDLGLRAALLVLFTGSALSDRALEGGSAFFCQTVSLSVHIYSWLKGC